MILLQVLFHMDKADFCLLLTLAMLFSCLFAVAEETDEITDVQTQEENDSQDPEDEGGADDEV